MCIIRAPWGDGLVGQLLDNYYYNYTMLIDYKLCALSEHPEERALLELLDNYDYNYTMLIDCKLCSLSEHPGERALLDKLRQERQAFLRKHSHKGVKGGNS